MRLPDEVLRLYTELVMEKEESLADLHFWRNLAMLLPYAVKMPRVRVPHQRREPPDLVPTPRLTPRPRWE